MYGNCEAKSNESQHIENVVFRVVVNFMYLTLYSKIFKQIILCYAYIKTDALLRVRRLLGKGCWALTLAC